MKISLDRTEITFKNLVINPYPEGLDCFRKMIELPQGEGVSLCGRAGHVTKHFALGLVLWIPIVNTIAMFILKGVVVCNEKRKDPSKELSPEQQAELDADFREVKNKIAASLASQGFSSESLPMLSSGNTQEDLRQAARYDSAQKAAIAESGLNEYLSKKARYKAGLK